MRIKQAENTRTHSNSPHTHACIVNLPACPSKEHVVHLRQHGRHLLLQGPERRRVPPRRLEEAQGALLLFDRGGGRKKRGTLVTRCCPPLNDR